MFILKANKNKLAVLGREPVTSGSVNVYRVRFEFSDDWEGLRRKAVFQSGGEKVSVLLDETGECDIPWEVLKTPFVPLEAGVYGTQNDTVLPTIWANLGTVLLGAEPGTDAAPPTPDLWEQELDRKGDKLDYTPGGDLGLYAGDKLLSAVPVQSGGGDGGTADHRLLSHRDAEKQHPISAIDGLNAALSEIPTPMTADQLRKILMNGGK